MTRLFRSVGYAWGAVLACTASAALAQEAPLAAAPQPIVAQVNAVEGAFGAASAIEEADLRQVTGREDTGVMIASATQRNTVANNSVTGTSTTGSVQIDGNAFQNLQGLAVISANSGNNVAINSAMNVTVNMAPR